MSGKLRRERKKEVGCLLRGEQLNEIVLLLDLYTPFGGFCRARQPTSCCGSLKREKFFLYTLKTQTHAEREREREMNLCYGIGISVSSSQLNQQRHYFHSTVTFDSHTHSLCFPGKTFYSQSNHPSLIHIPISSSSSSSPFRSSPIFIPLPDDSLIWVFDFDRFQLSDCRWVYSEMGYF